MIDTRWYQHKVPTNYTRIRPDKGSGFILNTLYIWGPELTRKQIFDLGNYHGGSYRPGLLSMLFTALLEDKLIECSNGKMKEYHTPGSYWCRSKLAYRIVGNRNEPPKYSLTEKGQKLVESRFEGITIPPKNLG